MGSQVASVVVNLETLKECTLHVLDTFAVGRKNPQVRRMCQADRCIYLELRTSPKQFKVGRWAVGASCHMPGPQW